MYRHKYSKDQKCLGLVLMYVLSNTSATFEAQLIKRLSSTEAELKKCFAYRKSLQMKG